MKHDKEILIKNMEDKDPIEIVENEDKASDEMMSKPWNPKDIRITTKTFSIREVFTQIEEEELDLAPDFQRAFVWKDRQQIRLVESILLGIPLPAFYFNQDSDGNFQVIDGVQRLTTIKKFMSDELSFEADAVEYLKSLSGLSFSTLDPATRRRFSGTQIVVHVIEPQTPDEVKYDIFSRVNTGGSPLTAQEIRHCMSKDRSRKFLKSLVNLESFDDATEYSFWVEESSGIYIRNNRRMADSEMALRFCAFHVSLSEYSQAYSLDAFLLDFTRQIDKTKKNNEKNINITKLIKTFDRAMINCWEILGEYAFRRCLPGATRRGPLNRAIFESQALALSEYELSTLLPYKEEIRKAFLNLFTNPEYDSAVRAGTGDYRKVIKRIELPRTVLAEIVK